MTAPSAHRLLVVDDEPDLRTLYALTLLREDRIAEYERTRERQGPSTLSLG